jgi:DNA-binding HxlR family transcriptional regulator
MADIKAEYLACPIRNVISRFGGKWSMLVLFMLHRSETGILRFNEIRRLMTDCSQKMLSQTLKNLEQSHLVHREVYPEVPPRVEYSLTDTGKSLMPYTVAVSHRFSPAFIAASNTGFNVSTSVYYCINFTFDASRGLASGCSSG